MNSVSTHTPAAAYNNTACRTLSGLAYFTRIRAAKKGCQRAVREDSCELFSYAGLFTIPSLEHHLAS
jgi:hypothetical protein